ncbi:MAG: outer membrane beta-barrel protein [Kangiellaceae bacterium]|nr:outer membrane beta-barrel protein [Kangiellaceae bacterium]MCW8999268.1 outer membrane beta-barrel protein [Kangiellaceae bacterium]MCW9017036.1 outer membrane beta-barrel protein [Kangiellaceae bacterium]
MKLKAISIAILATLSAPVFAEDSDNSWIFRTGAAHVSPNDDSGTVLGGGVGVDDSTGLGLSFTYMLDNQWGIEILGALPFSHDIVGTGALSGVNIGETKHLPPTFSMVYQWGNETKYHVGAGLNYTVFFDEEAAQDLNTALNAQAELDLDSSLGVAVKFGFDTPINNSWNFSGSVYYMNIETTADVIVNDAVAASVDVDINPWVVMLGVSTTF